MTDHEYFSAPAAEPAKGDQGKTSSSGQKIVENGNQGLTAEMLEKNKEAFFRKHKMGPTEKHR